MPMQSFSPSAYCVVTVTVVVKGDSCTVPYRRHSARPSFLVTRGRGCVLIAPEFRCRAPWGSPIIGMCKYRLFRIPKQPVDTIALGRQRRPAT